LEATLPTIDPLKLVVLLEDDLSQDPAYAAALEARGFHAVTVSNATAAIKVAQERQPIAVLVHLEAKQPSYADALRRLRKETSVPILCLVATAHDRAPAAADDCDLKIHKTGQPNRDLAPLFDAMRA
jgi:DNA-binding response OmpR family regulator